MAKVEQGVHAHFARLQQQQQQQQQNASCPPTSTTTTRTTTSMSAPATDLQPITSPAIEEPTSSSQVGIIETPFAKINSVVEGSPAAQAGIKVGDMIRSVGHVNWMNHENLTKVAEVVQQNEGVCFVFFTNK